MSIKISEKVSSKFSLKENSITLFLGLIIALTSLTIILGKSALQTQHPYALESKVKSNGTINEIDEGRYRLEGTINSNEPLKITFENSTQAKYFMIRSGYHLIEENSPLNIRVIIDQGQPEIIANHPLSFSKRYFFQLPTNRNTSSLDITFENVDNNTAKLVIDELGLYKTTPEIGKTKPLHWVIIVLLLGILSTLGFMTLFVSDKMSVTFYGTLFFIILPVTVQFSLFFFLFHPDSGLDLKVEFFSGELSYTRDNISMATNILAGKGLLLGEAPPWCRMPGYPLILSIFGSHTDPFQTIRNGIILQIVSYGLSLGFLFWSMVRIMPVASASLIGIIISFLPFKLYPIWIESIIPSVVLFCSAAGCLLTEQLYKGRVAAIRYHILLHFGLALWFFIRADVLPAWGLISIILYGKHWRTWKYFSIPLALFLLIGVPWALFKQTYTDRFSPTTESVGASLMGGLWEIPHKFIWSPTDEAYFSWMESEHQVSTTKAGSDFAVKEVFRFYCTYPIYTCSMIWHKFLLFSKSLWWTHADNFYIIPWIRLLLLSVVITSFLVKFKGLQTLLLSWPILFNAPLFFLFWSGEGRFWKATLISLLISSIPLLLDKEFYLHAYRHRIRVLILAFITGSIILFGPTIDDYLLNNNSLKYWAPFLDPRQSSLCVEKSL